MKKVNVLLAIIMACIIFCGVNTGVKPCGQEGKDIMGVLSYSQNTNEY